MKFGNYMAWILLIHSLIDATMIEPVTSLKSGIANIEDQNDGIEELGNLLGQMLVKITNKYLFGCNLVTVGTNSTLLPFIAKALFRGFQGSVLVEVSSLMSVNIPRINIQTLKNLWNHPKDTCRGLLIDLTTADSFAVLSSLEVADLWLQPKTIVIFVGGSKDLEKTLYHKTLRNIHHTLYLSLHEDTLRYLTNKQKRCILPRCPKDTGAWRYPLKAFWRCHYCNNGEMGIETYGHWNMDSGVPEKVHLFHDQTTNFNGHTFKIVGLSFFPLMDYTPDTNLPGTKITLKDCLDKRILTTVAAYLNFTYIIREPEDGEWGLDQDGNWTGIVGELQHNKADFSLLLGLVYSRAQVMDFSSIYSNDRWVIISLKNQPLPKSQALVTPFTGPVWIGVIIATLVAGVALWLLNSVWRTLLNVPGMSLSLAMLYTWGALVCIPASNPPNRFNIRMLICWLWIFTFIVSSAYKSSLIAHLTIPTFPPPINSFEDLVHSSGITWGSEPLYGTEVIFFNSSLDPAMREFYSKLQFGTLEEHMTKVMEGKHAFFNSKWYIKHVIASQYTNTLGYTPLHFSQHQYPTSAGSVWGVRRGGIFNYAITRTRVRLTEVGLFAFWMDDVINTRAKQVRRELKEKGGGINFQNIGAETMNANTQEVLSLNHLQGAFYILFAGTLLAFTILLLEIGITCLTKEMHV